jgi:preprotein translocase subunit SecG
MVYSEQRVVFPTTTKIYIGLLILVLLILVFVVLFASMKMHQLSSAIGLQSELLEVSNHIQAKKSEARKKE